jgi:hypothetical protein
MVLYLLCLNHSSRSDVTTVSLLLGNNLNCIARFPDIYMILGKGWA